MILKNLILFLVFGLGLSGVLIWQADQEFTQRTARTQEANLRSQALIIKSGLERDLQDWTAQGQNFLAQKNRELPAKSNFLVLGQASLRDGQWTLDSSLFQAKSKVTTWAASYIQLALQTIHWKDIEDVNSLMVSVLDPQKKPYLLLVSGDSHLKTFALLSPTAMQKWIDVQSGLLQQAFLMTQAGQVLAHTLSEYVGSVLTEDALVAEISTEGTGSGTRFLSRGRQNQMLSVFERVPGTNLYVVLESSMELLLRPVKNLRWQMILFALGILTMAMGCAVLFNRRAEKIQPLMPAVVVPTGSFLQKESSFPLNEDKDQGLESAERWAQHAKVASALSHELKSPLSAILASAKLLEGAVGPDQAAAVKDIENEARYGREILQKVLAFSGELEMQTVKGQVDAVLQTSIRIFQAPMKAKGIALEAKIDACPESFIATDHLMRVFEQIFQNAIEAMERWPNKKLQVSLKCLPEQVHISVKDSGVGIAKDLQAKVMDPFFTTKHHGGHSGLGLSLCLGLVKEMGGELQIISEENAGTEVLISLPIESPVADHALAIEKTQELKSTKAAEFAPLISPRKPMLAEDIVAPKAPSSNRIGLFEDTSIEDLLTLENEVAETSMKDNFHFVDVPKMPSGLNLDFIDRNAVSGNKRPDLSDKNSLRKGPDIKIAGRAKVLDGSEIIIRKPGARM